MTSQKSDIMPLIKGPFIPNSKANLLSSPQTLKLKLFQAFSSPPSHNPSWDLCTLLKCVTHAQAARWWTHQQRFTTDVHIQLREDLLFTNKLFSCRSNSSLCTMTLTCWLNLTLYLPWFGIVNFQLALEISLAYLSLTYN